MRKEKRDYKKAVAAFEKGKKGKAKRILLQLRPTVQGRLLVDVDLALLSCLNQAEDHTALLEITDEGMQLSREQGLRDPEAVFAARKAVTLLQKQPHIIHRMKCITLPPEWFEFATEREKLEHEFLERSWKNIISEANSLMSKAVQLASQDPRTQHQMLFEYAQMKTQIFGARFMVAFQANKRAVRRRLWAVTRSEKRELLGMLAEIERLFVSAAKILASQNDETGYVYCFYNLAIAYRGAWQYRKAKKYLDLAEEYARKCNVKSVLANISEIKQDLKQKGVSGRDVDYRDFLNNLPS